METKRANLPLMDMTRAKTDREAFAKDLVHAMSTIGFLLLEKVEGVNPDRLLEACQWFFTQPLEKKFEVTRKRWNKNSKNVYRGYFPTGEDPNNSSHKEAFEFGVTLPPDDADVLNGNRLYENPQWPTEDGIPFKEIVTSYFRAMHQTAIDLIRLLALGLGFDEHCFDEMIVEKPLSTLRLLHYPPRRDNIPDTCISSDGKVLTCDDHHDTGLITVLETFNNGGLEVIGEDGTWMAVEPKPGTLIVNIGDLLVEFCGGHLKATRHRVVDIGVDRYSVPFFMEPSYHTDINRSPVLEPPPEGTPMYKYGHWMIETVTRKQFIEYEGLDASFNWQEI